MSLGVRRSSMVSPSPGSSIPRPNSVNGHRPGSVNGHRVRRNSDTGSQLGQNEAESRNVRVVLRVRPSDPDDASVPPRFRTVLVHPTTTADVRVDVDPATLAGHASSSSSGSRRHPTFTYDHVLGEESDQVELFDVTAKDTVDEFLKGHNVTFLAYGQTSSGKSYSMGTTGEDADYNGTEFNVRTGLIPRTVQSILDKAEEARISSGIGASWECRLSFLELYNEEIIDLLSGSDVSISIREERDGRIIWSGVREVKVKTLAEVMQYLYEGSLRRKTGETGMNATSSRSHAIFSLTLVQKRRIGMQASTSQPISSDTLGRSLKRPSSTLGFASASRSPTPSGSRPPPSSFQKGSAGRPQSFISPPTTNDDFVVVTSKFNMVDLAGSERLKRTAAQGDRMKEGISINSGLLALGNVISHLADPVKSKGHIPYRDSKLTRMLQDSIGGNSITTMIACVSPIEYNVVETLNTMKYASRARSIRNQSKINAVEAGWDDVEHLQSTVLKLRKQIAIFEMDGGRRINGEEHTSRGNEKLIQRLADLQREHTELYDRYLAKCSESMRLTSELRNAKPGDADALAKFNETVEPVIIEYEKVVSELNKQLDGLRAELTAISDMYEEQGRQLEEAQEKHSQNETYVTELRGRVTKLHERNTSGEAYIQDLEGRLKSHVEKDEASSGIVGDLRKEIARLKEANVRANEHTMELEARLTKSDGLAATLTRQVETHEKAAEGQEKAYRDLESHIAVLDTNNDNKALLAEMEEKENRIIELEQQLRDLSDEMTEEQTKLLGSLEAEKTIQEKLIAQLSNKAIQKQEPVIVDTTTVPPALADAVSDPSVDQVAQLRAALEDLANKCVAAEDRYAVAESKIFDLTTQLSEAKLIRAEMDDIMPVSPALASPGVDDDSDTGTTLQTPLGSSPSFSPSRPSPVRRRSTPILSSGTVSKRDFRSSRGPSELQRSRPLSLSQELSSAQSSVASSRLSWAGSNNSLLGVSPSKSPNSKTAKSSQALEAELKYVHGIVNERDAELKDREAYIQQLEQTLRAVNIEPTRQNGGIKAFPESVPLPASPTRQTAQTSDKASSDLSPQSTLRFKTLKESFNKMEDGGNADAADQTKVNELLEEMAVKERSQREIIDQQYVQIADLQKANNKLREDLYEGSPDLSQSLQDLRKERDDLMAEALRSRSRVNSDVAGLDKVQQAHSAELEALIQQHASTIEGLQNDHAAVVQEVRTALENARMEHQSEAEGHKEAHDKAIATLNETHSAALAQATQDQEALVAEMEKSLSSGEEQRRQLKMKADQSMFELSRVRDEHQFQRTSDLKQINDLQKANAQLERIRQDLETANEDLRKRVTELEHRYSMRKTTSIPPQGPPPTAPLPPLPQSALPSPIFKSPSSDEMSNSTHRSSGSTALTSIAEIEAAVSQMPETAGHVVQKVVAERDSAVSEREALRTRLAQEIEKMEQSERQLQGELIKSEGLTKDLHEARKTSSKLRAHLEDARQETRRVSDECRGHMDELNDRRDRMAKLSEESGHQRDSLTAANAQLATLRAQLDRAVDARVNKKLNNRLKCF